MQAPENKALTSVQCHPNGHKAHGPPQELSDTRPYLPYHAISATSSSTHHPAAYPLHCASPNVPCPTHTVVPHLPWRTKHQLFSATVSFLHSPSSTEGVYLNKIIFKEKKAHISWMTRKRGLWSQQSFHPCCSDAWSKSTISKPAPSSALRQTRLPTWLAVLKTSPRSGCSHFTLTD